MADSCSTAGLDSGCATESCVWQTYTNLLDWVKLNLGAKTQKFELSDEDMIDIFRDHSLPEFSKYVPLIRYYRVTYEENLITEHPTFIYEFTDFCYSILKINNVIGTANLQDLDLMYNQAGRQTSYDVSEFLMSANYSHMSAIAIPPQTWRFFPPNKIELMHTSDAMTLNHNFITELACVHNDPTTIDPDMYNFLRDLALADIMIFVGRIRSRFESFTSPYGEVQVASRSWVDEGNQLREKTLESLRNLPPDLWIAWLN